MTDITSLPDRNPTAGTQLGTLVSGTQVDTVECLPQLGQIGSGTQVDTVGVSIKENLVVEGITIIPPVFPYVSNAWLALQMMTQQEWDESILCEVSELSKVPGKFLEDGSNMSSTETI